MSIQTTFKIAAIAAALSFSTAASALTAPPPPPSLEKGVVQNDAAQLYREKTATVADNEVLVDYLVPDDVVLGGGLVNTGFTSKNSNPKWLPAGTYDSWLVHFDPQDPPLNESDTGSFTFDTPILAIILSNGGITSQPLSDRLLVASDGIFGAAGTTYEFDASRRGEKTDLFGISNDQLTLSYFLHTTTPFIDNIRVLTASPLISAIPLPAGGWLLLTGLGALALRRKKAATDTAA